MQDARRKPLARLFERHGSPARDISGGARPLLTDPDRDGPLRDAAPKEGPPLVEYLVRAARITDVERLTALGSVVLEAAGHEAPLDAADLLRQLVYLPQASVLVAEARREVVGAAVLALRPSVVAGGYVGTVDMLVVDPAHDADRVIDALLEEVLRSAANKGCSVVETARPSDTGELGRLERQGFRPSGELMRRPVATVGAAARRT